MTKYLLILAFALVSFATFASNPIVIFEDGSEKIFTVSTSEFTNEVSVSIYNWEGERIFNNDFDINEIDTKTFDANSLPDGQYIFIIADESKEKATPFVIESGELDFRSTLATMTYTPGFQQLGNSVHINALIGNTNRIGVSIFDENRDQLFEETYRSEVTFKKIFDLSALPTGFYVVRVSIASKNYRKTIEIK